MKMYTFNLAIPAGERSVELTAPLKCDSLGVMVDTDTFNQYTGEQRASLYENLINSLAHMYHSSNVMSNVLVERLQSIVSTVKEADGNIGLEHGWKTLIASSDDQLELEFFVTEINEQGIPIDADEPNGFVVMSLTVAGDECPTIAMSIKKHLTAIKRAEVYTNLFELINTYVRDVDTLAGWTAQLDRIFGHENYPVVANPNWSRKFTSGDKEITFTYCKEGELTNTGKMYIANGLVAEYYEGL